MKSKKLKSACKQPSRATEQNSPSMRSGLSFLKNRLFSTGQCPDINSNANYLPPDTDASTSPQSTSPRTSTSSSRMRPPLLRSPFSTENHSLPHKSSDSLNNQPLSHESYKQFSKSFDDTSSAPWSPSSARPVSTLELRGATIKTGESDNISTASIRRRPRSVQQKHRTSMIVLKDGYLYKKADFRAFHKPSKFDRSWKLYRVVLRGHKLYLYKMAADSQLKSLFPHSSDYASVSSSRSNSSITSQQVALKHPATVTAKSPTSNESSATINLTDMFDASLPRDEYVYGALFIELNHGNFKQHVCLLIFMREIVIGIKTHASGTWAWEIDERAPLSQVNLEETALSVPSTPRSMSELSTASGESLQCSPFSLSLPSGQRTFAPISREIGLSWMNAYSNTRHTAQEHGPNAEKHDTLTVRVRQDDVGRTVVDSGTIRGLVHELLYQTHRHPDADADDDFLRAFLLTYSMFTSGTCVLDLLKEYVTRVDTQADTARLYTRVFDIFQVWCTICGQDVVGNVATGIMDVLDAMNNLDDLDSEIRERKRLTRELVLDTVTRNGEQANAETTGSWSDSTGTTILDIDGTTTGQGAKDKPRVDLSNILITGLVPSLFQSIDPTSFAEQIYIFHLGQHQCHHALLQDPLVYVPRPYVSPQLLNSLLFTTSSPHFLTKLVRHHILIDSQQDDLVEREPKNGILLRTELLEHWIRVGLNLFELGDMTGWCAVATGICSIGVIRLKEAWKSVDRDLVSIVMHDWVPLLEDHGFFSQAVWVDGWETFSATERFGAVLDADILGLVHKPSVPGLPFFGTIKQSVDRFRKHAREYTDTEVINFSKYWCIYNSIHHCLDKWKKHHVNFDITHQVPFPVVGPLQAYFERSVTKFLSVPHDFKYLQECSLACEPRIFGQSFDRHRKLNSLHGSDVAPPSSSPLSFPEILESYKLFPSGLHDDVNNQNASRKLMRKKGSNQSIRSDNVDAVRAPSTSVNSKGATVPGTAATVEQTRSPRVTRRKMFRRRTYSFPPGGRIVNPLEDEKGDSFHENYLDSLHSRTWLGSLIADQNRSHSAKAVLEALMLRDRNHGEWILVVHQEQLILKASTLLQSDDSVTLAPIKKNRPNAFLKLAEKGSSGMRSRSGTLSSTVEGLWKEDEATADETHTPTTILVNVKAGILERLVDVLVHGVSEYNGAIKEQWQLPSLQKDEDKLPHKLVIDEEEYVNVFFVTYRSFCSCVQLLDLLRKKFIDARETGRIVERSKSNLESVFQDMANDRESEPIAVYDWKMVASTQHRIVGLMMYWVEEHFYDFVDEIEIIHHVGRFLKEIQVALDEWRMPLEHSDSNYHNAYEALAIASAIDQQISELRSLFIRKILSPCYDLKAIKYDIDCSRRIDELYRLLTSGCQSFSAAFVPGQDTPLMFAQQQEHGYDCQSLVDKSTAFTLLQQADHCVHQLFASVTLQDWIQTFDVFEAQSSDLYAWLPARKASQTPPMSSALSPVIDAPSAQQTDYHIQADEVIVSDIFTAIEGARRSIVSPTAFSADDLLLAFPSCIQYLCCMHFIIRSWVIHEISAQNIALDRRVNRIDKFLHMVTGARATGGETLLFPELNDFKDRPSKVPSFVEYAVASALISPEVRLFTKAWAEIGRRYGQHMDTLEQVLNNVSETNPSQPELKSMVLVPSVGWIFDRMLELCSAVPDYYRHCDQMINFDKRRYVFHFIQLVMNAQMDLEEQPRLPTDVRFSFSVYHNPYKISWKTLKEIAHRENKSTSQSNTGGKMTRSAGHKTGSSKAPVFNQLVSEQLDKWKKDVKERDRIDKDWRDIQHKLQKRQIEQARLLEKQGKKGHKFGAHHHHFPKFLRGLKSTTIPSTSTDTEMSASLPATKASTVINLIHSTTSVASAYTKREHVFRIVTEEGGQYLFQGANRDDMLDWMQHINNAAREGAKKRESVLVAESATLLDTANENISANVLSLKTTQPRTRTSVYGVPLEALMPDGNIPILVEKCTREIERRGLEEVGIYRLAGMGSTVNQLKRAFNTDAASVDLSDPAWADINVVADALKQFLRELPGSLLTHELYDAFIHASASEDHDKRVYLIKHVLKQLPPANYTLVKRLIEHFVIVTDFETTNHMYATNLAIVFGPTLLQPSPGPASFATIMANLGHHQNIVKYLILHYHYLFDIESEQPEPILPDELKESVEETKTVEG